MVRFLLLSLAFVLVSCAGTLPIRPPAGYTAEDMAGQTLVVHPVSVSSLTASEDVFEDLLQEESEDPAAMLAAYLESKLAQRWIQLTYLDGVTVLDTPMDSTQLRHFTVGEAYIRGIPSPNGERGIFSRSDTTLAIKVSIPRAGDTSVPGGARFALFLSDWDLSTNWSVFTGVGGVGVSGRTGSLIATLGYVLWDVEQGRVIQWGSYQKEYGSNFGKLVAALTLESVTEELVREIMVDLPFLPRGGGPAAVASERQPHVLDYRREQARRRGSEG